jgi:hypothetical protein
VKGGKPTYGDFLLAGPISDAFNLAAVSLRMGGKRLLFDSANAKIKNVNGNEKAQNSTAESAEACRQTQRLQPL